MKKNSKILTLFIYVAFTQIYPVVHWHEQEHHGEAELQLSIHPAEVHPNLFDHQQHDHHNKSHEHENKHYNGDLDYLNQSKISFSVIYDISALTNEIDYLEAQVSERIPIFIPLKIPNPFHRLTKPNRAPPFLS